MFNGSFFKMAYFNLWRRKSRTILVIAMIGFGLTGMIFSQGLYDGMVVQMIQDQIRTGTGELIIYQKGYEKSNLLSDHIRDVQAVEERLKDNAFVTRFTSRVRCDGVVSSARYSQGARIIGIDSAPEKYFIDYKDPVIKGEFRVDGAQNLGMIGEKLARKLKVGVGKKIVIQGQALNKEIVAAAIRVAGILRTNNPQIDTAGVLMDKKQVQQLFKVDGVTEVALLVRDGTELAAAETGLIQELNGSSGLDVEIFTWKELYPIVLVWEKVMDYFVYISYGIIFLVVALGIFFILFISIMERVREFGILTAMGTPFSCICQMVFYESLIMGLSGYGFGAFFGWLLLDVFRRTGLDLSAFSSGLTDVGMAAVMYPVIEGRYFLLGLTAIGLSSALAAVIPLWKLKKLRTVEAIRFI